ncbi:MAG: tRNA-(ms[2]io[6]A)-hydroxylase [Pseudohongiellaceae bacterium]
MTLKLQASTQAAWLDTVLSDFDSFLLDHASCEKKASGMALSIISHYPDRPGLLKAMLNLAVEELNHYREVMSLILDRGLQPAADSKDAYVNQLHKAMDQGKQAYLLDRLLVAAIIEARGAERFGLIAQALPSGKLKNFYLAITESESRHYQIFLKLARENCVAEQIPTRLQTLLEYEARIIQGLPLRAALH